MVGARNASLNALRHAEKLVGELAEEGYIITSGLARGIDAAAHNSALAGGAIAVIAGGPDELLPTGNTELQQMIEEIGLLLAGMPPARNQQHRHFLFAIGSSPALHLGSCVEAASRSGSLITAPEALERGGEVMAIPLARSEIQKVQHPDPRRSNTRAEQC